MPMTNSAFVVLIPLKLTDTFSPMSKQYRVSLEHFTPEFSEVDITANDPDEAEEQAIAEIEKLYPEAIDIEVTGVIEITE